MPGVDNKSIAKIERAQAAQQSGSKPAEVAPSTIATMFGQGEWITLGGAAYEVSPVRVKLLAKIGVLINKCPELLVTHAMVAAINGGFDLQRTVDYFRGNAADEAAASTFTIGSIGTALAMGVYNLADENVEAMVDLVVLVLQRRDESVTAALVENDLDIPVFLEMMRALFTVDPHMRDRFPEPGATV